MYWQQHITKSLHCSSEAVNLHQTFICYCTCRLSQETNGDVQSNAIDWLELAIAVEKQACKCYVKTHYNYIIVVLGVIY